MGSVIDRAWLLNQHILDPVCIGLDVGQIHDPSAICISEVMQKESGRFRYREPKGAYFNKAGDYVLMDLGADPVMRSEWYVRSIKRLPIGMSYPNQAVYIAEMLCNPLLANRHVRLLMDVTGVGKPVFDTLSDEIWNRKEARHVRLKPIKFTHGETYNQKTGSLGKAYLVSRLQSLLQNEQVHGPDTSEMKATLEELKAYEIKVSKEGKDTYGAEGVGKHDDLATALALSCLENPFSEKVTHSNRVY
jgi:hypothetical protein